MYSGLGSKSNFEAYLKLQLKMSRLYDTVEPSVINDAMLKSAVEEQGPKLQAGVIAKEEGINYEDILCLRLDFRSNKCLICYFLKFL